MGYIGVKNHLLTFYDLPKTSKYTPNSPSCNSQGKRAMSSYFPILNEELCLNPFESSKSKGSYMLAKTL